MHYKFVGDILQNEELVARNDKALLCRLERAAKVDIDCFVISITPNEHKWLVRHSTADDLSKEANIQRREL